MSYEAGQTPAEHLQELFARVQNPFDVSDTVLAALERALMHQVELLGRRHRNTPLPALRCSSHRHVFLLADGRSVDLWELRYDGPDGPLSEIYDDERPLRVSEERIHQPSGGGPLNGAGHSGTPDGFSDLADLPDVRERDRTGGPGAFHDFGDFVECGEPGDSGFGEPGFFGESGGSADFPGFVEHADAGECGADGPSAGPGSPDGGIPGAHRRLRGHREYTEDNSPEHARRLLRRAENADRPADDTLRLLATAQGHEIAQAPRPPSPAREWHVWCSLYEHAFLLADGREFSLYELEHNLSATGHLVCEVYPDEEAAAMAVQRLVREQGSGWGHDACGP